MIDLVVIGDRCWCEWYGVEASVNRRSKSGTRVFARRGLDLVAEPNKMSLIFAIFGRRFALLYYFLRSEIKLCGDNACAKATPSLK